MDPKRHLRGRAEFFDLLRHLLRQVGTSASAADIRRFIAGMPGLKVEPDSVLRRLVDEGVLVRDDDGDVGLHPHVEKDVRWLIQHQRVDTPEVLRARISAFETHVGDLSDAVRQNSIELAVEACAECDQSLREMAEWSGSSRRAVIAAVMAAKARADGRSSAIRLKAILDLHDRYVVPLRDIVKEEGQLPAAIFSLESAVREATSVFGRDPSLTHRAETMLTRATSLVRQAFEDFLTASREVLPLYQKMRRDSMYTQAVAHCLDTVSRSGVASLGLGKRLASPTFRADGLFGVADLKEVMGAAGRRAQQSAPRIRIPLARAQPAFSVPTSTVIEEIGRSVPVRDLLGWLMDRYAEQSESTVLRIYSEILDSGRVRRDAFAAEITERELAGVRYRYHTVEVSDVA